MARILCLFAVVAVVVAGCKTIEGGYESNKEKQNAKQEKMMNEGE